MNNLWFFSYDMVDFCEKIGSFLQEHIIFAIIGEDKMNDALFYPFLLHKRPSWLLCYGNSPSASLCAKERQRQKGQKQALERMDRDLLLYRCLKSKRENK